MLTQVLAPVAFSFHTRGFFQLTVPSSSQGCYVTSPLVSLSQVCLSHGSQGVHPNTHLTPSLSCSKLPWLPIYLIRWTLPAGPSSSLAPEHNLCPTHCENDSLLPKYT